MSIDENWPKMRISFENENKSIRNNNTIIQYLTHITKLCWTINWLFLCWKMFTRWILFLYRFHWCWFFLSFGLFFCWFILQCQSHNLWFLCCTHVHFINWLKLILVLCILQCGIFHVRFYNYMVRKVMPMTIRWQSMYKDCFNHVFFLKKLSTKCTKDEKKLKHIKNYA